MTHFILNKKGYPCEFLHVTVHTEWLIFFDNIAEKNVFLSSKSGTISILPLATQMLVATETTEMLQMPGLFLSKSVFPGKN